MFDLSDHKPKGETPRVYLELIDRLTTKYACICDLEDENDAAWSDGPLRNNAEPGMVILGLNPERVSEVLPFVVKTANDLGLVVFDEQEGRIHRPPANKE
jgi:hypothetical protein